MAYTEHGAIRGVKGYMPEDLGDYYLHTQVKNRNERQQKTSSFHAANVVIINSFPRLSQLAGQCGGMSHESRQAEVFLWVEENKEHLKLKPTVFSCSSWTCKLSLAAQHSIALAEINATILINELNRDWLPRTGNSQVHHTRKHYGIPIPYSAHHSIPRPPLAVEREKQFLFVGSLRREPVRDTLASVADEPGVFLEVTGLTASKTHNKNRPSAKKLDNSYARLMQTAAFCFVPRGDTPSSRRLFDAMISGCLPVIISDGIDRHLPFSSVIPYSDFVFRIREKEWNSDPKAVLQRLRTISVGQADQRRTAMAKYAPCIDWLAGENVLGLIVHDVLRGLQREIDGTD